MKVEIYQCRNIGHKFPIIAWIIMLFQGMNPFKKDSYNHVAMSYVSETGNTIVVDATGKKGVCDEPMAKFLEEYEIVRTHVLGEPIERVDFLRWKERIKHRKYDKLDIFGDLLRILGFASANKVGHNYRKMTCNKVILSYVNNHYTINVGDPDTYDLNTTWKLIEEL